MSKLHGRENDSVQIDVEPEKSEVALREEAIQAFWEEHDIFNKSVATPGGGEPSGTFVFYDGPPFATGTPHYGHILAGTIKDAIPRFWTMNGLRVERKWGWDCHGLPLENLIEKKLGLANKREIEAFGIKNFNEAARAAVLEYRDDWKKVVPRMGRFVDMEHDYKTMDSTYTESVWSVFKKLHEKGLVYEGFKSMHLCPRCGTTLSNFEVNQGYKDIKDIAVTVKLPLLDETGNKTDTSLLVWTTTPWTLPGNMAAAVHKDFEYVKVKVANADAAEFLLLAKGRLAQLGDVSYEVVESVMGADLVGRSYEPPFAYLKNESFEGKDKAWKIYHADYVELGEDGTGAVHIAPAYGEEDMVLAKEHGIPIKHHVDYEGRFMPFVTDFAGKLVKPKDDDAAGIDHKDADIEILKALQVAGKIFKKENITHSYPHCWRDDTPLLNYATTSWFVKVTDIKDDLVAANEKVQWVPEHVGKNRFGKWLEGARDWAISRQRYWGAPLPIWRNPKTGDYKVFGSLSELKAHVPKSGNEYFVMRHAEAESNLTGVINSLKEGSNPLTPVGEKQCQEVAEMLKDKNITRIVHSGMERTKQTAELIAKHLGLLNEAVLTDERIIELQVGRTYEGKTWTEYNANYASEEEKFVKVIPGVENRYDLIKRVGAFLYEFNATHSGERVLIVSHASSTFALQCVAEGAEHERVIELKKAGYLKNAEVRPLPFTPVPHNDYFALDYHRPYIDDIALVDTDGTPLVRVPDVFDCWFESGSMPYGQHHYPFTCDEKTFTDKHFPAQFIAEGLDQTRGWFYSLIVLGTALFGKSPYENVIVNGLVLAEDGKKMSKSLRNYPDPMELVDRVGADAVRFYLLSSPVIRGEDLNFSEKEVLELQRKNIGRLHNVLAMYEMFADGTAASGASLHILDRWIISRLNQLIAESTTGYQNYELDRATRPLTEFIDDLSVWYLRRSRERLKGNDAVDRTLALSTLRFVLIELAKVMAPAMPFYAEYLWQAVKPDDAEESVHLTSWPKGGVVDEDSLTKMSTVRTIVSAALEARTKVGIKVSQPLNEMRVAKEEVESLSSDHLSMIIDEVNVKGVMADSSLNGLETGWVALDTIITAELKAEGDVRVFMRAIQERRKAEGLDVQDRVDLLIETSAEGERLLTDSLTLIQKTVGASLVTFDVNSGDEIKVGDYHFRVLLKKL